MDNGFWKRSEWTHVDELGWKRYMFSMRLVRFVPSWILYVLLEPLHFSTTNRPIHMRLVDYELNESKSLGLNSITYSKALDHPLNAR